MRYFFLGILAVLNAVTFVYPAKANPIWVMTDEPDFRLQTRQDQAEGHPRPTPRSRESEAFWQGELRFAERHVRRQRRTERRQPPQFRHVHLDVNREQLWRNYLERYPEQMRQAIQVALLAERARASIEDDDTPVVPPERLQPIFGDPLSSGLSAGGPGGTAGPFDFLSSIASFFKDFIKQFRDINDRGFANVRNFRRQFRRLLGGHGSPREGQDEPTEADLNPRYYLQVDAYHHERASAHYIVSNGGGVGIHIEGNPDTEERRVTLAATIHPVFGEVRNLWYDGTSLGNDIIIRGSAAAQGSVRIIDEIEPGFYVSIQPQWKNFGRYRVYSEIFVRFRTAQNRWGNEMFYVQDVLFIPRFVYILNTDGPILDIDTNPLEQVPGQRTIDPLALQQPPEEMIFMGSLSFRFSL